MDEDIVYIVALGMIPGIGPILIRNLLKHCNSAKRVFETPKQQLEKIPNIGIKTAQIISNFRDFDQAESQIEKAIKYRVKILCYSDENYPKRLKQIHNFPPILYYKGNADLNTLKILTIVGTRNGTSYGKNFVKNLVRSLSKYKDIVIVSGLAYGIDIQVHKEALKNNISTIAVVAHGLDIIYPREHKDITKDMIEQGGILSEYRFGIEPEPLFFPARNRIIAGISDAVIVVESSTKGGSLITADLANDYNREVFALPGNIQYKYSKGCHDLIKNNKAHLITDVKDLEYIMAWEAKNKVPKKLAIDIHSLSSEKQRVIQTIQENENIDIDRLAFKTQLDLNILPSILLDLELKEIIKALPGKIYTMA